MSLPCQISACRSLVRSLRPPPQSLTAHTADSTTPALKSKACNHKSSTRPCVEPGKRSSFAGFWRPDKSSVACQWRQLRLDATAEFVGLAACARGALPAFPAQRCTAQLRRAPGAALRGAPGPPARPRPRRCRRPLSWASRLSPGPGTRGWLPVATLFSFSFRRDSLSFDRVRDRGCPLPARLLLACLLARRLG